METEMETYRALPACRACLDTKSKDLVNIFSGKLHERYEQCTALTVEHDDPCPQYLCVPCSSLVESFCKFREQCHQSEAAWKTYVVNVEIKSSQTFDVLEDEVKEENNCGNADHSGHDSDNDFNIEPFITVPPVKKILRHKKKKHKEILNPDLTSDFVGQCNICQRNFLYKTSLIKHVNSCVIKKKYRKSRNTTKDLSKLGLPYSDALFCGICKETSSNVDEISKHLLLHQASNDLNCKICGYAAFDFADLFGHRFSHQPPDIRPKRACFICTQIFLKVETLEFHFRGKHLNKSPGLCKVCKKGFNNYKHFVQHQLIHTGQVYACDVCNKTFTFEKSLMNHISTHSGMKTFMCHLCGFKSRQASGLRSHHYRHHTEHEKILCIHCGKTFKNSETLREHMARVTAERTYNCSFCKKGYRSEKEMLNHVKWHSEDKPYSCDICGNTYKAKGHLKCHMRNHTGERPYVCRVCNMGFTSTNVLKRHNLTHTGEKAFSCGYCKKLFAAKNNLKRHISRHIVGTNQSLRKDLQKPNNRLDQSPS